MTSDPTYSVAEPTTRVFLGANVIAKPVTRTLLMAGGPPSGFTTFWSATAESEATRHMRRRSVPPSDIRRRFGGTLGPTGAVNGRFNSTAATDRQILADADAGGASFLITEDVDDFDVEDLTSVGISAVTPDLFLASRLSRRAYAMVIALFVERQVSPPTTPAEFHSAIARQHLLLFAAHSDLYPIAPMPSPHPPPAVVFRGPNLVRPD